MKCKLTTCQRPKACRGYCEFHYRRWLRHGDPLSDKPLAQTYVDGRQCEVESCDRQASAQNFCKKHYLRWWKYGDPNHIKIAEKGVGHLGKDGYRTIKRNGRTKGEHVWVMEEHLGRELYADERVHHINGERADNRLENLELWSTSHPAGQRVADKLQWAYMMIERYAVIENPELDPEWTMERFTEAARARAQG
jgi:hypothetical protein